MLVHQAPCSLLGRPIVAARLIEVQDLSPSHDCLSILHGESCPLNDQCRLPGQGFSVDSLELAIANAVLSIEECQAVLRDLRSVPIPKQLNALHDRVS